MKWISVKDKLPEDHGMYLCYYDWKNKVNTYQGCQVYYFSTFHGRFKVDLDGEIITYWMPLPEPPNGEE